MISVIVPYDKDRGFLAQCVASIDMQTYRDYEIVMAHSDKSVAVNFNDGLRMSKGEFCKFVTEDDYLPENSLGDLTSGIGDAPWAYANAIQHDDVTGEEWPFKTLLHSFKANVIKNQIHGGSTIYRTDVLRSIGGMDESLWTGEEYEMHLRLWSKGFKPAYIDKEVYVHRLWSGQKSKKYRRTNIHKRNEEIKRIQALYSH